MCRALELRRSVYRYRPRPNRDGEIIKLLLELAHGRPEQGFGKLFRRLRRLGHGWNHKRVYRVYCALKLNKRRKGKRRLPTRNPAPLQVSQTMNECWSADFMSDALWDGPRFRTFNVIDDCNREALAIVIDFNLPAARVVRELDRIAAVRGYPLKLRIDNGPELISLALAEWAEQHGVDFGVHQTRQTDAERLYRKVQSQLPGKRYSTCSCFKTWKRFVTKLKSGCASTTKSGHMKLWDK